MLVAAGERLAADGRVVEGASGMDIAFLTGESAAVRVGPGDAVQAGALNVEAPITVLVTAAGPDTVIADIARLMDEAGQGRSRHVRIADRAARYYAPAVHLTAALAFMGWMIAGAGVHQAMLVAIAVLLITCPCALGLAVPAAQVVACGALMRRGILVKDGSALERVAEVDSIVFDKTGTLTLGRPVPEGMDAMARQDRAILLALAREEALQTTAELAAAAGGSVDGHVPNCIALYNAYLRCGPVEEDTVVCLANLGHETIDIALVRGVDLLFARNLSGGGKVLDDAILDIFPDDPRRAYDVRTVLPMIVDDEVVRIGSANLNNRSMALDSECDVILDANRPHNTGRGLEEEIRSIRVSLLAEHCGVAEDVMAQALERLRTS